MALVKYNENVAAAFGALASALQGDTKPILKFEKGDWLYGAEGVDIPAGTQIAANVVEASVGWLLWRDKRVEDRRMVSIASGQRPAARSELGHEDAKLWPLDKDGKPQDPWARSIEIPARMLADDMVECVLAGSSKGWEGACKRLFEAFGKGMRENDGKVPIVTLNVSHYDHKVYGRVKVPVLDLVEWRDMAAPVVAAPKAKTKF